MRPITTWLLTALMSLSLLCSTPAHALDVGQQAPPLTGVSWVKGDQVKPGGKVTVVEFWATWCGPCRESIPYLTKLQKRYHDQVQIVGLSNETPAKVKPFVEEMGDKMSYHVGIADAATHASYMEGIDGIPHAFLIDAKGVVLWIGHPQQMAEPLAEVIAGTFDVEKNKRIAPLEGKLQSLISEQEPDLAKANATIDEILAIDPVNDQAIDIRLAIAHFQKKPEAMRETLQKIPLALLGGDHANSLAWSRATDENLNQRNLDLALGFIQRALTLEPNNPSYLDTRARLEYDLGDLTAAIATLTRAIELDTEHDPLYPATLAYYKQVVELRAHPATAHGASPTSPPP